MLEKQGGKHFTLRMPKIQTNKKAINVLVRKLGPIKIFPLQRLYVYSSEGLIQHVRHRFDAINQGIWTMGCPIWTQFWFWSLSRGLVNLWTICQLAIPGFNQIRAYFGIVSSTCQYNSEKGSHTFGPKSLMGAKMTSACENFSLSCCILGKSELAD